MRARAILALALIALPVAAEAQRIPRVRIGDRTPGRAVPLPPRARSIAREMVYVRLPFSVASYPLIAYYDAPALNSRWTSGGAGTRMDLRVHRMVSLTLDLTNTMFGGPITTNTVEIGTRIRPVRSDSKWQPFFDVRGGYLYSYDRQFRPYDFVDPTFTASWSRMNHGIGGVIGGGVEYNVHPRWTITSAASLMRSSLSPLYGQDERPAQYDYTLTATRFSVGLRWNPGRWTMPANLPQQIAQ